MSSNLLTSRLTTPKGIRYALTDGPRTVFNNHGEATLVATYRMFVADLGSFMDELMPAPIQIAGSSKIVLDPTLKIANYLGSQSIFSPTSASVEPLNADLPMDYFGRDTTALAGTYNQYALVTVNYSTNIDSFFSAQRSNAKPEEFLEPSFSTTAEVISYKVDKNTKSSTESFSSAETSTIKDFSAPLVKVIPISERTFRWPWALNPDFDTIFGLLGWLNNAPLRWMDFSPAGTVMFMGLSGKREYRWAQGGRRKIFPWNLEYKFAQRCAKDSDSTVITWNHFFNPDTGRFQYLRRRISDTASLPLYNSGDLNNLFLAKVS